MTNSAVSQVNQSSYASFFNVQRAGQTQNVSFGASGSQGGSSDTSTPRIQGGGLIAAIMSALGTVGTTSSTSSADGATTTTGDDASADAAASDSSASLVSVADALGAFMQTLMSTLRAQSQSGDGNQASNDGSVSSVSGNRPNVASDLQSLISKLESGSSSDASSGDLSALQSSFDKLVGLLGGQGGEPSLDGFLHSLADKLPDPPRGMAVNTSA
jgi:hypothetical protein